ncbi:MAG: class I SAM-dependent methyltransferase [Actinomycetota bacterium]|nr:class I SAM-dependent methyltransferase [Actinomycetota bacterium]
MTSPLDDLHEALASDSESYFERNGSQLERPDDPVLKALRTIQRVQPSSTVLEIGCANGWRLEAARREFGSRGYGIDASAEAVSDGSRQFPELWLSQGLAPADLDRLPDDVSFDCIVLGYFMYLLPRADLFPLAAVVDQLLVEGGHLIVFDFIYPTRVRSEYRHDPALTTFKMDPSSPWSWSPNYSLVERTIYHTDVPEDVLRDPGNWGTVDVLRKLPDSIAYTPIATREVQR